MSSEFLKWAPKPPMGWNSWDCFGTTVNESQTLAHAEVMSRRLLALGWNTVVVDIQWYEPDSVDHIYKPGAELCMDEFGRLLPAPKNFPSGFKALGDRIHGLGLKFGIHLMRGIPRQALRDNTKVKGTDFRAKDIADTASTCFWNPDMYGVDMSRPGAQAYYDSVFELIASWGVDFVKVDDLARPYYDHEPEIEAIRAAIDKTGRPMVLSISPGETAISKAGHVSRHVNLWRISDDFWDEWRLLKEQFLRLEYWNPFRVPGAWPDADMLPFGDLAMGTRKSRFTPEEQKTCMTLWCIARSPLMFGGDLTKMDDFTWKLIENPELLAVNQASFENGPLFNRDGLIAWTARPEKGAGLYLALFNIREEGGPVPVNVDLKRLGFAGSVQVRDLWEQKSLGSHSNTFAPILDQHAAGMYLIS